MLSLGQQAAAASVRSKHAGFGANLAQAWQRSNPTTQRTLMGAGIGALGGGVASIGAGPDERGETHHLRNMALGAGAGGLAGRYLGGGRPGATPLGAGTQPKGLLPAHQPSIGQAAAQHAAPAAGLNPQEHAQAEAMKGMTPEGRRQALGMDDWMHKIPNTSGAAHPAPAAVAPARPGFMRRNMGTLATGGLGLGAAAAYGALHQNAQDVQRDGLVYAPMQGVG